MGTMTSYSHRRLPLLVKSELSHGIAGSWSVAGEKVVPQPLSMKEEAIWPGLELGTGHVPWVPDKPSHRLDPARVASPRVETAHCSQLCSQLFAGLVWGVLQNFLFADEFKYLMGWD